ncbi:MAG: hypothetical protein CMQ74_00700 [Gammaproteobacteria bacterium]|jgi:integrase|nr:hypothetical protein [Gammaproteobacteria bacterium]|tara:strand:+ start:268 stop:1152 length:885 start_codon:yes stop_codon:yes gene_type:complete
MAYTIKQAFKDAWKYQWEPQSGNRTTRIYALEAVNYFGPNTPVEDIDAGRFMDYRFYLEQEKDNLPATINNKTSKLKVFQEMAIVHGRVKNLPLFPRNLPLRNKKNIIWEQNEIDLCTEYLRRINRKDAARQLIFLCEMGCRPIEMRRQTKADYNLKKGLVTFFKENNDNKTGNRTLPLTPKAAVAAAEQILSMKRPEDDENEFSLDQWTEKVWPLSDSELHHVVRRALEACSIPKSFIIKATRHTCGTALGRKGCTELEIANWLGHSSPQSCRRYVHMDGKVHTNAYNALVGV